MHQLPLTPRNKQKAWTTILHIAKTNRFPLSLPTKLNSNTPQDIITLAIKNTDNTTQKNQ